MIAGLWRAAVGVLFLSVGAALVRLAEVSAWNVAFWRGALVAIALTTFLYFTGQIKKFTHLKRYGLAAIIICAIYGLNIALFVFAVVHTKVANVMVILCCTPLFAAALSWLMLGEHLAMRSWLAIITAVLGVIIVFAGSISINGWQGDLMALVLAFFTAFLLTYLRKIPHFPRVPAIAVGGALSALMVAPWSAPFAIPTASIGYLLLLGILQKPVASVLMLTATRYITSAEVSLFLLLEIVLAPLWVWLAVGENVPQWTWLGGSIVVLAVASHCVAELWISRRSLMAQFSSSKK